MSLATRLRLSARRSNRIIPQQQIRSLTYLKGAYGGFFHSEALPGALPPKQNSPQKPPYGLYNELLSGTSFTLPKTHNKYTWTYRIRPHVQFEPLDFEEYKHSGSQPRYCVEPMAKVPPMQFKFPALAQASAGADADFLDGITTICVNGNAKRQDGATANVYAFSKSMEGRYFRNNDADLLILPESGTLEIRTELGTLEVGQMQMALIPRGITMQVNLKSGETEAKGYMLENFGDQFVVPDLGPIGVSSGLAHPRHFESPVASFEDKKGDFELVCKFQDNLWTGRCQYSPFDVVAWYGNYVPCMYDMRLFMAINSVTHDHPDPSIGCVLVSPTGAPGLSNIDFVIFPPRWMTAENTFRPPWYHRNYMSEYMGLLRGSYDAKAGFMPGASSIHNQFLGHGPDSVTAKAGADLETSKPVRYEGTLAFMWESNKVWTPTEYAYAQRDIKYKDCWQNIESRFDPNAEVDPDPPFPFDGK